MSGKRKTRRRRKAYTTDILRTIQQEKRRFFSLLMITVLGVTMFSGLQAACMDLRYSADQFFDEQNLHDVLIRSTLGLTEEDLAVVQNTEGVEAAEAVWTLENDSQMGEISALLEYRSFTTDGMNLPYVVDGTLPNDISEAAVTQKTASDYDLKIGDSIVITEIADDDSGSETTTGSDSETDRSSWEPRLELVQTSFTITAIVTDPEAIDNPFGSVSYRNDSSKADTVFVLPTAFDGNYFTGIRIRAVGAAEEMCYTTAYEERVSEVKDRISEELQDVRETARTTQVIGGAQAELDEAKADAEQEFANAEEELTDAEKELADGRRTGEEELADAQEELDASIESGKQELIDAQAQLDNEIAAAQAEIVTGEAQISDARTQLEDAKLQLSEARRQAEDEIKAGQDQIDQGLAAFTDVPEELLAESAEYQTLIAAQEELDIKRAESEAYFAEAEAEINATETTLAQKELELAAARQTIESNRVTAQLQIDNGWAELESGRIEGQEQIDDGRAELEQELADGQAEIDDGWAEYETNKTDAEAEFADAQAEIDDLKSAKWYVQDRESISGYANVASDADSIEAIGTAFPVVFFIVAILISLTTITRMVEEDRSLIGSYKSLGFTDHEIRKKYLIYAGAAGIGGSVIGTILAFLGLPAFIFLVFDVMYLLPSYSFHFVPVNGIAGPLIFLAGILLASAMAVRSELKEVPASLMRPLAPKAGSRILLERIRPLWQSFTFLQKVTARNLFRYKKRLFMTIFGIAGCTALMLFGFSIRDSVQDLSPRQYEETFRFDLMSVADTDEMESMSAFLEESQLVQDFVSLEITSAELKNADGKVTSVTVMIVPSDTDLSEYIHLKNKDTGNLQLQDDVIYVTRNAANVLGLRAGDLAELKLADLQNAQIEITELTENYLGNYLYMTDTTYVSRFEDYEVNAILAHLGGTEDDQIRLTDDLKKADGVLSVTGIAELESQFFDAFMLINMVVAIVLLMSAALAFVVLFTLATTNISERLRELATIKVLGFFDPEVHIYVNRETMILTVIGIVIGMPLGRLFAESLTVILNLPSIYLAVSLKPHSYIYAVLLNLFFAWIVSLVINRTMDQIDPVEALKSVE